MKIQIDEDGTTNVYVRQSWIGDALMCNERGRQGMIRSEWNMPNDATILGTAVHAGIASILEGKGEGIKVGLAELNKLLDEPFNRVKYTNEQLYDFVHELVREFDKNILPHVGEVVAVEKSFTFPMDEFILGDNTVKVHGIGTMDCLTTTGIWDWKTAARKYSQRDKQSQAVQPTMYAAAAVANGWLEYPATFKYGVLVRGGSAQILSVHRNESHADWLKEIVRPFIRQALLLGTDQSWTKNDTHYLCSQTWCSYWSICKGSKLTSSDIQPQEGSLK